MNIKKLENIKHFTDAHSIKKDEPGLRHSYIASLATALNYITGELDPVWLMGSSAFAFRIFINEIMCPSAMSMFSFKEVLPAAIAHAEGKEWIDDRPKYQNGIVAFDLWASIFEKWAWIEEAGKSDEIGLDIHHFSRYYAEHYYSARCYARDYLKQIAEDNEHLHEASLAYERVADFLKPLWVYFSEKKKPQSSLLKSFTQNINDAKSSEEEGIKLIKKYLNKFKC